MALFENTDIQLPARLRVLASETQASLKSSTYFKPIIMATTKDQKITNVGRCGDLPYQNSVQYWWKWQMVLLPGKAA
jgi:hypothetical protein